MNRLKFIGFVVAFCALLSGYVDARAQAFPSKPVRLIVPFAPGGTTDVLARIIAQKLSTSMGQSVIVDNRPGANGNIGTDVAAKSPGDGYTLVMSFDGTMAINPNIYKNMPFDPKKDLAPVANIAQVPLLIVVHPSLKANTIEEFIALVKASPYLAGGRLRALAFTSAMRVARLPNVPTLAQSGFPGFDVTSWYGILAPASTPSDLVQKLNGEIVDALAQKDIQERFSALGIEPVGGSPAQFAATINADMARWATVVKKAGIRIE